MKSLDIRTAAVSIIGMAFLWPPLHTSAYYPLSIAFTSQTTPVAEISAYHVVYTIAFIAVALLILLLRRRVQAAFDHSRALPLGCAVLGAAGSLLLAASPAFGSANVAAVGAGIALVAFSYVPLLIAWGSRATQLEPRTAALVVIASYVLFSALWLMCSALGIGDNALLVAAPLVSGACLAAFPRLKQRSWAFELSALKPLPYEFVAPCIIFVYFGVVCVKALTVMQIGIRMGALTSFHLVVTAAVGLVISIILLAIFWRKGYSSRSLVVAFALLVLCYMASLLAVMLGLDSDYQSFYGKRALVGTEHVIELLLFMVLACAARQHRISPALSFGLYAIVVVAAPQFIASDLMYQTGMLDALTHLNLIVPLVAVASFVIAAVAIGLLVRMSAHSEATKHVPENWQEELCRSALADLDLSPREFDVAVLAYRGYSAKAIASTLYVSESTVKTHTSHIYRKAGIHTKQELIAYVDQLAEAER